MGRGRLRPPHGGHPRRLAERLAARADQRGLSVSDLLAEYAEMGLRRDEPDD